MQSGSVKLTTGVVRISPIEGPGVCGMDIPLKVAALGDGTMATGYAEPPRPPGGKARGDMPDWSAATSRAPVTNTGYPPPSGGQIRMKQGPPHASAPLSEVPQQIARRPGAPLVGAPQTNL